MRITHNGKPSDARMHRCRFIDAVVPVGLRVRALRRQITTGHVAVRNAQSPETASVSGIVRYTGLLA